MTKMVAAVMLIVNGECDQIVCTEHEAKKEMNDLVNIGYDRSDMKIKRFDSWAAAEAYEDKLKGL